MMIAAFYLLIDLAILLGIAWWLYRRQSGDLKVFYWPALVFKVVAGVGVGCLYFYHYGQGDTLTYWQDGKAVAQKIFQDPTGAVSFYWAEGSQPEFVATTVNTKPRSLFFIKIAGVLAFVSGGNYWVMSGIISFIAFTGGWYFFVKAVRFFPSSWVAASVAILFYPSVVFWSSGLIKESLGLAALYFLAGISLTIIDGKKIRMVEWGVALLSLWIGWNLKYYWIGVFMPVAITTLIAVTLKRSRPAFAPFDLVLWLGIFTIILFVATHVHPNFYPRRFPEVIWQNNLEFMSRTESDNAVHYDNLQPSFSSLIMKSPKALMAGLFRPLPWESRNFLALIAGVENFILLALVLTALPSVLNFFKSPHRILTLAIISYIIILSTFLALSTPNFGTLSRYKIGFLPFLVFLSLYNNSLLSRLTGGKK